MTLTRSPARTIAAEKAKTNLPGNQVTRRGERRIGTISPSPGSMLIATSPAPPGGGTMNGIIYLVGLIVVIMAILSFLGLR